MSHVNSNEDTKPETTLLSDKQKAAAGLVISLIVSIGSVLSSFLTDADTLRVILITIGIASAIGTTLGVYYVPNKTVTK